MHAVTPPWVAIACFWGSTLEYGWPAILKRGVTLCRSPTSPTSRHQLTTARAVVGGTGTYDGEQSIGSSQ